MNCDNVLAGSWRAKKVCRSLSFQMLTLPSAFYVPRESQALISSVLHLKFFGLYRMRSTGPLFLVRQYCDSNVHLEAAGCWHRCILL